MRTKRSALDRFFGFINRVEERQKNQSKKKQALKHENFAIESAYSELLQARNFFVQLLVPIGVVTYNLTVMNMLTNQELFESSQNVLKNPILVPLHCAQLIMNGFLDETMFSFMFLKHIGSLELKVMMTEENKDDEDNTFGGGVERSFYQISQ